MKTLPEILEKIKRPAHDDVAGLRRVQLLRFFLPPVASIKAGSWGSWHLEWPALAHDEFSVLMEINTQCMRLIDNPSIGGLAEVAFLESIRPLLWVAEIDIHIDSDNPLPGLLAVCVDIQTRIVFLPS